MPSSRPSVVSLFEYLSIFNLLQTPSWLPLTMLCALLLPSLVHRSPCVRRLNLLYNTSCIRGNDICWLETSHVVMHSAYHALTAPSCCLWCVVPPLQVKDSDCFPLEHHSSMRYGNLQGAARILIGSRHATLPWVSIKHIRESVLARVHQ